MAKIFLPLCGAAILGFSVLSTGASAATLSNVGGPVPLLSQEVQIPVENVGWRQVCRPVPRWFNGQQVFVERCRNVWVDRHGPGYGYGGYGRPVYGPPGRGYGDGRPAYGPPGPAYGYGGPYRGGPGYY